MGKLRFGGDQLARVALRSDSLQISSFPENADWGQKVGLDLATSSLCLLRSLCPLVLAVWGQWEWLSLSWKATFKERMKVTQAAPDACFVTSLCLCDGLGRVLGDWVASGGPLVSLGQGTQS